MAGENVEFRNLIPGEMFLTKICDHIPRIFCIFSSLGKEFWEHFSSHSLLQVYGGLHTPFGMMCLFRQRLDEWMEPKVTLVKNVEF